ncbi:hypothetical protein RugamoR64_42670 [Duganella rhizosphaerae]|uniref:HVO_A0114 family putative DNA-binding protein n=1 Tax=Duganella rhizosphaerae TaxID=2885763 RepID=UPI0030E9451F
MKTVTLEVRTLEQCLADFRATLESGEPQPSAKIVFVTEDLMNKVLTPNRLHVVSVLCGAGAMSVTETARRVGRTADEVEADIQALLVAGVIDRHDGGGVIFPYDEGILDLPTAGRATV